VKQGTREWLDARATAGIGGSESPAIYNKSPWISQFGLWARKTGRRPPGETAHPIASPELYWGTALEDDVRDAYQIVTGRSVVAGVTMLQHPAVAVLFANTDGTIEGAEDRSGAGVYEGKATFGFGSVKWRKGVPVHYLIQLQQYLACTGLDWGSLAVFLADESQPLAYYDVPRDDRFCNDLAERADRWWTRHVVRDIPPEPDGSSDTADTLAKIWPNATDDIVPLEATWEPVVAELDAVRTGIRGLEKRRAELEHQVRAVIGPAGGGSLPNGTVIEIPTIHRKPHSVAASSYRKIVIKKPRMQ
jgi:putative phage-type endonuclease